MLMTKIEKLRQLAGDKANAQMAAKAAGEYRGRQKSINDMVAALRPSVEGLRVYRKRGLPAYEPAEKTASLRTKVREARKAFKDDKAWIIDLKGFDYTNVRNSVAGERDRIDAHLKTVWADYLKARKIRTNYQILNLLAKIAAFKDAVAVIKALDARLQADKPPMTDAEFARADEDLKDMETAWKSLRSDEFPQAILDFLAALGPQGAPFSALTPEVLVWLKQEDLLDSFRVHVAP